MELEKQSSTHWRTKVGKELISWGKTLGIVLLLVLFIQAFFFTNYIVYGKSMMPTIHDQERIIINKIGYRLGEPERFDMIVFHATASTDYIKRVIGLPGDRIEYRNDVLFVNGKKVDEPHLEDVQDIYVKYPYTNDFTLEQVTGERIVPENHVFVLGDNRRNSIDSRQIGFIPFDKIVGKADLCYWPIKESRVLR